MILNVNKINTANRVSFTSKNEVIRKADNICRLVNSEFPIISPSYFYKFSNIKRKIGAVNRIDCKLGNLRDNTGTKMFMNNCEPICKLKSIIDLYHHSKVGNCSEKAELAYLIARLNGLENLNIASFYNKYDNICENHSCLLVNDKKPYIIDPWLGIADYAPNAIQMYKNEFSHHFVDPEKIKYIAEENSYRPKRNPMGELIDSIPIETLKQYYPNLLLNENKK